MHVPPRIYTHLSPVIHPYIPPYICAHMHRYRYKDLSLKLEIVRDNSRFFLEILHNHKSTGLETVIIILIAMEMVIGLCGLAPDGSLERLRVGLFGSS